MISQKNIILLAIVVIALVIGIATGLVIYYSSQGNLPAQNQNNEEAQKKAEEEAAKKAEEKAIKTEFERRMAEEYPDLIKGTLDFSSEKVTIKTEDGKEYWLWPPMSGYDYENNLGWKDGQTVEIQGKIMPKDERSQDERFMMRTI